jgi:hypothetical protein
MGIVRMGVPESIVKDIATKYNIGAFVETGTFKANTAIWASTEFDKVYTIEASEALYNDAKKKNSSIQNIEFLQGNSRDRLAEVVSLLKHDSAIVWLDAHWSGGETYGQDDECPLLDELDIIFGSGSDHIILIDDARLFLAPPPKPHNVTVWPNFIKVACKFRDNNYDAIIHEDIIFGYPAKYKEFFSKYFQELVTVYSNSPTPLKALKMAVSSILKGKLK